MKRIEIPCAGGSLAGILHLPSSHPCPVVVCSHGLLSDKEGAKYAVIAEELTRSGLATVRFDFSGCGESVVPLEKDLIASRVRDLCAVSDFVSRQPWANGSLSFLGSSFGGYVALLAASSGSYTLSGVVCWATPFDLSRAQVALDELEALKRMYPPGFLLGEPRRLGELKGVSHVLVLHGQKDEVIPWGDGVEIYRTVEDPKHLILMENVDHRFLDPSCRQSAIASSVEWLRRWSFDHRE